MSLYMVSGIQKNRLISNHFKKKEGGRYCSTKCAGLLARTFSVVSGSKTITHMKGADNIPVPAHVSEDVMPLLSVQIWTSFVISRAVITIHEATIGKRCLCFTQVVEKPN